MGYKLYLKQKLIYKQHFWVIMDSRIFSPNKNKVFLSSRKIDDVNGIT